MEEASEKPSLKTTFTRSNLDQKKYVSIATFWSSCWIDIGSISDEGLTSRWLHLIPDRRQAKSTYVVTLLYKDLAKMATSLESGG